MEEEDTSSGEEFLLSVVIPASNCQFCSEKVPTTNFKRHLSSCSQKPEPAGKIGLPENQKSCRFCSKTLSQFSLNRHQKICSQNPESSKNLKEEKICQFCLKKFLKSNIHRHQKLNCPNNPAAAKIQKICKFCLMKVQASNFYRHQSNCTKNPGSTINKACHKKQKTCKFCSKQVSQFYIYNHQNICLKNPRRPNSLQCNNCRIFLSKSKLKEHIITCHSSRVLKRATTIMCLYPNCELFFHSRKSLIEHIGNKHDGSAIIPPRELTFDTEESFTDWKDGEEALTFSHYTKHSANKNRIGRFYCQYDGSLKPHRKNGEPPRKTNKKMVRGQVKTGCCCTSYIRASYEESGSVSVLYYPTHNHPLNPHENVHHEEAKSLVGSTMEKISVALSQPGGSPHAWHKLSLQLDKVFKEFKAQEKDGSPNEKLKTQAMQSFPLKKRKKNQKLAPKAAKIQLIERGLDIKEAHHQSIGSK